MSDLSFHSILIQAPHSPGGDIECMLFHQAVATKLGMSNNEHRCIVFLLYQSCTPSSLAHMMGMTTSAMTTLIDRLEKGGHVVREPDRQDRRRIFVKATENCRRAVNALYTSLSKSHKQLMAQYTPTEQRAIEDFLVRSAEVTYNAAEELRQ
jgi:DNA-binding MarR family transcriptional regulator